MSSQAPAAPRHVTVHELRRMKESGERIAMVTAYDATAARLVEAAGVDAILVGDSLGMVVQGHGSTLPVTLEQMAYHSAAVRRGLGSTPRAHLVCDLPFGTYQASADDAVRAAARLVAEGGAESVKLEGGADYAEVVRRLVRAGVPVMGHIGLTPQSVHQLGGYRVQGKDAERAQQLVRDARALEAAGCYALVLECVPAELARLISSRLLVPTIGIGAGPGCDGQVLVLNDLLGLDPSFTPKFVKRFAELGEAVRGAVSAYAAEVRAGTFPDDEHSFHSSALRLVPLEGRGQEPDEAPDATGAPV
ncbi:MAG TPA: 3-methyl-2-oxobutanoate hydroxymethyltransferase [Anaeromyxobacter sp.]|nr:3-methyl-2-oxobutanoate hydroxymethyltransferase [Anaeromyxobacter sp.]